MGLCDTFRSGKPYAIWNDSGIRCAIRTGITFMCSDVWINSRSLFCDMMFASSWKKIATRPNAVYLSCGEYIGISEYICIMIKWVYFYAGIIVLYYVDMILYCAILWRNFYNVTDDSWVQCSKYELLTEMGTVRSRGLYVFCALVTGLGKNLGF